MTALVLWLSFFCVIAMLSAGACLARKHSLRVHKLVSNIYFIFFTLILVIGIKNPDFVFFRAYGFTLDPLTSTCAALILFMSSCVQRFSLQYMTLDQNSGLFNTRLCFLSLVTLGFVMSDHIGLAICFWFMIQILLARLLAHKSSWIEAKNAARIYLYFGMFSTAVLAISLLCLSVSARSLSLYEIANLQSTVSIIPTALLGIVIASGVQAGIYPVNRWLSSSLNAPTPVSAYMHAGVVAGGAILMMKLATLFAQHPQVLHIVFILGSISLVAGTLFKLLSSNVKKMLAFSTTSQMGYMFLQIGLGLFPAALCHILWHSLFKGYLFLNSGSLVHKFNYAPPSHHKKDVLISVIFSLISCAIFYQLVDMSTPSRGQLVMTVFPFFTSFFISSSFLKTDSSFRYLSAFLASCGFCSLYGLNIYLFEKLFSSFNVYQSIPLSPLHIGFALTFCLLFISINFASKQFLETTLGQKLYVYCLSSSQSYRQTVSLVRNRLKN